MRRFWFIPLVCMFVMAACSSPPPEEPEDPEEPPPPTAEEIAMEFNRVFQGFEAFIQPGQIIPAPRIEEGVNAIRSAKSKFQSTENGEEGVRRGAVKAQEQLKKAYEAEAWGVVLFDYRALAELDRAATENYQRQLRLATIQQNRPQVSITTVYVDKTLDQPTLFCNVYSPATGQTEDWRASPGDVWSVTVGDQEYSIRFDELIGKNSGGVFTYIQTDEQFEVRVR